MYINKVYSLNSLMSLIDRQFEILEAIESVQLLSNSKVRIEPKYSF